VGGKAGIWVGIALVVVGVLGGIGLVVAGARSVVTGVEELERVPIDGGTIDLDGAGTVDVYGERNVAGSAPTTFSSSTSGGPVPDIDVVITGPDGEEAPIRPVPGSEEYHSDGHWGTRIGRLDADRPGIYTVEVVGGADAARYDTIAVGDSIRPQGLWLIVAGVLGGGLVVLVGIIVIIVSAVKRGRARKRSLQGSWPNPPGTPGPPPPGWPPVQA